MIIASIDIGTNTILLLIAETDNVTGNIIPLLNLYRLPRIGKGLKPGLPISPDKIKALLSILSEYKATAEKYKCDKIITTATNALRIASNADEIINLVKEKLDIDINVIPGKRKPCFLFGELQADL